jgi:hypothetical protein
MICLVVLGVLLLYKTSLWYKHKNVTDIRIIKLSLSKYSISRKLFVFIMLAFLEFFFIKLMMLKKFNFYIWKWRMIYILDKEFNLYCNKSNYFGKNVKVWKSSSIYLYICTYIHGVKIFIIVKILKLFTLYYAVP